ncbi:hypothetical protein ACQI4L_06150 [Mycolicibacterium litorale]|uniref:hypothetical protein n=1 Tax=Mycolicibacterium litorale TaxID=758802 RepID=UPI003CE8047D
MRRRENRGRGRLRPAITGGLAVLGATALVGTFVTPAPAEARSTTAPLVASAPTPTPLLAALTLPFTPGQVEGAVAAAALIGIDLDAELILRGDVVALLARIGASLRLDIDLDAEEISAAFAALINDIAAGIDGGIAAANGVVDLGAALVAEIALAASEAGVAVVDAITGALLSTLAALTPDGEVAADLSAAIGGAIEGIGELFATGFVGAGAAVAWKATLDDVLVDLVATGGIALTNGLAGGLLAALGVDADLPDIDGGDVAAALAAVINHFATGIDGGLLTFNGAVDIGAAVVADIALAAAAAGVDVQAAITGAFLATLEALAPEGSIGAPLAAVIGDAVEGISTLVGTGILGVGEAIAWKFTLDDVLVDLAATAGVALVNGVAGGLAGVIGVPLPDLPDIDGEDVAVSLGALIDHFTDGINGALLTGGGAVELGVSLITDFARAVAEGGVDIRAAITGALLGTLEALAPVGSAGAPLAEAVAELVGDVSAGIDAGIRGVGEAVAWKFTLDDVLVDVAVAGGVSLVNGLTTGLFGGIGLPRPDLPDVDFAASVRALINHIAVGLGIDIDIDVDVDAGVDVGGDVDVDAGADVDVDAGAEDEGEGELPGAGADAQRSGADADADEAEPTADDVPAGDEETPEDDEEAASDGADDLDEVEEVDEVDEAEEESEDLSDTDDEENEPEAGAESPAESGAAEGGDAGDAGADTGGDTGSDSPAE